MFMFMGTECHYGHVNKYSFMNPSIKHDGAGLLMS